MTSDLTKIKGVGANSAKLLSEAGFATVESIAESTSEELGKVKGFGPARAERLIADAKELIPTNEPTVVPVVETVVEEKPEPVVVTSTVTPTKSSRFAVLGSAQVLFSMAFILIIAIIIAAYAGMFDKYSDYFPINVANQDSQDSTNSNANTSTNSQPNNVNDQNSMADLDGQNSGMQDGNAKNQQATEPEWIAKQREEAEKYQAEMQRQLAVNQQAFEPPWVQQQRKESEEYRIEMQRRFVAGLPPVEPVWITRQRTEVEEYRVEMQRRQAAGLPPIEPVWISRQREQINQFREEMQQRQIQHHQAMMNQRNRAPFQE